jgi:hypothetical protein
LLQKNKADKKNSKNIIFTLIQLPYSGLELIIIFP